MILRHHLVRPWIDTEPLPEAMMAQLTDIVG